MILETDLDHDLKLKKEQVHVTPGSIQVFRDETKIISLEFGIIGEASIEEGVGIGRLVVNTHDGREVEIAYFTNKKIREFRELAAVINRYVEGAKLEESLRSAEDSQRPDKTSTLQWLFRFAAPYRSKLLVGIVLSIMMTALSLVPPYLLKVLIDEVLLSRNPTQQLFMNLTLVLIISYASATLVSVFQNYTLSNLGQKIVNSLRESVYTNVVNLPPSFIDRISTGRILSRLTTDVGNTQWLMVWGLPSLIVNALTLIGIGTILFLLDSNLAIFVLIPVPLIIFALIRYRRSSHMTYHRNWRRSADVTSMITDTVPGYLVVKSFVREKHETQRLKDFSEKLYESQVDVTKMNLLYWPSLGFLTSLASVAIWWFGGNQVILGGIQLGVITAFVAYMAQFYAPINNLSNIVPFVQQAITSGDRLREIIEIKQEASPGQVLQRPTVRGEIEFRDVTFGYDPFNPVLKDFNLKIREGERVAFVGRSGSGKTSVARLLLRLYDIDKGKILVDGVDLKDIDLDYLRNKISYVPQEVILFDSSIAYNVSYGFADLDPLEVDPVKIINACLAAGIHGEIMKLPLAYDTSLGEKGSQLSGGQRQRISLARAMIKEPEMVILDEATSNLDMLSEREIFGTILRLTAGKSTIIVTHNTGEATTADRVVVMKNGSILETGPPKELLASGGEFAKMFSEETGFLQVPDGFDIYSKPSASSLTIDPGGVDILPGVRASRVTLSFKGEIYRNLVPKQPFPLSHPETTLMSLESGEKTFIVRDSGNLGTEAGTILNGAIRTNALIMEVVSIQRILIRGDELEWKLSTAEGEIVVSTKGRRNVIVLGNRVVLVDSFDNIYNIDTGHLDKASLDLLTRTL